MRTEEATEEKIDPPRLGILIGDCRECLMELETSSIACCITSPPYFGLRDYGFRGQIGVEMTPEEYVSNLVTVFRQVKRVLKYRGSVWLNLGDSYASSIGMMNGGYGLRYISGKNLIGIPWKVAFALQADGWILRSDIIWHKNNTLPENVVDRPTKSYEHIFLLSKAERYYYNYEAIMEESTTNWNAADFNRSNSNAKDIELYRMGIHTRGNNSFHRDQYRSKRNKRDVWSISSTKGIGSHVAPFPEDLPKTCMLAGSKPGDVVLDPFAGSGTTGRVALHNKRSAILIEQNSAFEETIKRRCVTDLMIYEGDRTWRLF